MPDVRELFGLTVEGASPAHQEVCRAAQCPHSGRLCDGGGNRDMVRWPAQEQPLAPLFDAHVGHSSDGFIPCGVCSVTVGDVGWAVCPRRLLNLSGKEASVAQKPLREKILKLAGFEQGDTVNVWAEVTLSDSAKNINYRLDYVIRRADDPPVIVEIMTASTSGGNKRNRTDMQSAFCDAVLHVHGLRPDSGRAPGVNTRQVWARMASQLIVKSEIANAWDGCAIWVVQDALIDYINNHTGLRLAGLRSPFWRRGEVNVISASLDDPDDLRLYAGPIHSTDGGPCWTDLLSSPAIPAVSVLTQRLDPNAALSLVV